MSLLARRNLFLLTSFVACSQVQATTYERGTVNITPIMLGVGNYSSSFRATDSKINGMTINAFRAANGFIVSDVEKMTRGYSGELGYFICDNVELKARVSYLEDQAIGWPLVVDVRSYEFYSRSSWVFSVGLDRYFNIKSDNWLPFMGIMGGVMFQEPTEAYIFNLANSTNLGNATLESAKRRFKGSLTFGADYRFNRRWAVGFTTGISYLSDPGEANSVLFGRRTTYRDNNKSITFPLYISIRNLIPCKVQGAQTTDEPVKADDTAKVDDTTKAEETKAAETKTDEKTTETKSDDTKATDAKTEEAKSTEAKKDEVKVPEAKAEDVKATEAKVEEPKATATKVEDTKTTETKVDGTNSSEVKTDEAVKVELPSVEQSKVQQNLNP